MTRQLIESIHEDSGFRLVMPFGLTLKIGDVVSVGRDGKLVLEGDCESLLGLTAGSVRPAQTAGNELLLQSKSGVSMKFRAKGDASTLFPEMPTVRAGVDIHFNEADSWLVAAVGLAPSTMEHVNDFRGPILDAFARHVWKPDWALITSVTVVESVTVLASTSSDAKVALSIGGKVPAGALSAADLTSNVSLAQSQEQLLRFITSAPAVVFCDAMHVRERWFRQPEIGSLAEASEQALAPEAAADDDFWQSFADR